MKNKGIGLMFAALLAFASTANADLKIGYVNAAKILDESPQAEEVAKKLKQEFSEREGNLLASRKEIKQLEEKMTRDGAVMSEAERSKLERELVIRKRDLQNASEAFQDDLNLRRNDEMNKLLTIVQQAIEAIGKEQHFDLIVYEGVAYASPAIDMTDKVSQRLREIGNAAGAAKSSNTK
jgi:outer membrane protein